MGRTRCIISLLLNRRDRFTERVAQSTIALDFLSPLPVKYGKTSDHCVFKMENAKKANNDLYIAGQVNFEQLQWLCGYPHCGCQKGDLAGAVPDYHTGEFSTNTP